MSYCRWSTDDFQCDVYVYEDACGGWRTHVAGNRVVYKEPLPPMVEFDPNDDTEWEAWLVRHKTVSRMVDEADRVPIGLPHAGETFSDDTPGECADRLGMLRALGYVVPEDVVTALRQEQGELDLVIAEGKERSDQ